MPFCTTQVLHRNFLDNVTVTMTINKNCDNDERGCDTMKATTTTVIAMRTAGEMPTKAVTMPTTATIASRVQRR